MILILSKTNDVHTRCVADALVKRGRRPVVLDTAALALGSKIAFGAGERSDGSLVTAGGEVVPMHELRSVWYRRSYRPIIPDPVRADADRRFAVREWLDTFSGLVLASGAQVVNDPKRQEAAVKPLQLSLARRLGLRVPDTLITNDATLALAFIERHQGRVVHKTLTPPSHVFLATKRWSDGDRAALGDLWMTPTIFQQAIECTHELRVTVVGDRLFAARFATRNDRGPVLDGRLDLDMPHEPHALPPSLERSILALVRSLGLVYSTIDLKLTDDGEYVFLELNPGGQFLYIEILTKMPISDAMAELLACEAPASAALAAR